VTMNGDVRRLDRNRVRELFDLRANNNAVTGGGYVEDPYPAWHDLREQAAVHPGVLHELTGVTNSAVYHGLPYPDRPHYTVFTFEACDAVYRNPEVFASAPSEVNLESAELRAFNSMLSMGGQRHRRYRGLVQPSFIPKKAEWWIRNWIESTVHELIDSFIGDGRAELNVDFCAAIPVLTITGSFGVPVDQALDIRASFREPSKIIDVLRPIIAARRRAPQDDLISVLAHAELRDEDGTVHHLTDAEINSFSILLLQAGSGTTWKQLGITLTALLERPEILRAIREDRALLRAAIDESLRWMPNLPMFSRWVTRDTELFGTQLPEGAVVHLAIGAANRDPARWERPDDFDITRRVIPSLGFGGGPHICLGQHVARAEMVIAVGALLDRLPNLRLDPDADRPRIIGMYERGATEIPVVFG